MRRRGRRATPAVAVCAVLAAAGTGDAQKLDEAMNLERKANADAAQSQRRIDQLSDETESLAAQYRSTLAQIASLQKYNRQLSKLVGSQEEELASLRDQIDNVTVIGRQVTPLMIEMIDALENFIELDVPMLLNERRERVAVLRDMMDRSDVADSEKYRRILEAYQIENDYGRTIETYQSTLEIDGQPREVDFLRFGRIALVYQTADGAESGAWDDRNKGWVRLGSEHNSSIRKGIRIANKQKAVDLVRLPVPSPEPVQ